MKAPEGAVVSIYYDGGARVAVGHVIQTGTGRRYGVVDVRVQKRGAHAGRQHLRCLVLDSDEELAPSTVVHPIYWYKRGRRVLTSRRAQHPTT